MTPPPVLELLRALPPGGRLWLPAHGKSLWPLFLSGDRLRVERCEAGSLTRGEVAVVVLPPAQLVAHLVVGTAPLRTASSVGVADPVGLEALGRVVEVRRGAVRVPLPRLVRHAFRLVPGIASLLKRLPVARAVVQRLRGDARRGR